MDLTSEKLLLARIQDKNEEALIILHQQYVDLVYSAAFHILNDATSAEDITQETFMALWNHSGDIDPDESHLLHWLLRTAYRLAIEAFRQRKGSDPQIGVLFTNETADSSGRSTTRQKMEAAFKGIPKEQCDLIELTYFYKMSCQDISEKLSIPLDVVKTRIRLGMHRLRLTWQVPFETA